MAAIVAIGAVSPLGVGDAAWSNGEVGAAATTAIARDAVLARAGLRRPFAARVPSAVALEGDPATALLLAALAQIEGKIPRGARVGVAIGTSSGGMASAEVLYARRAAGETIDGSLAHAATYYAPFQAALARLRAAGHVVVRATHPLTACAASTIAIGLGARWLDDDACDVAIVGGYDGLTTFVAAGFEALNATTATPPPRPFRIGRDGMALGEGAALLLLARDSSGQPALAHIVGFGCTGDALHLTAPDRSGGGLARAAQRALEDATIDPARIGLVSVHGTSTPFNDAMEARALARVLGAAHASSVPMHAAKATIGHTLGAAGALETALVVDALRRGVVPSTVGEGELDPEVGASPRRVSESLSIEAALKLSAAFGGANAAIVVTRERPPVHTAVARTPVPRAGDGARRSKGISVAAEVVVDPRVDLEDLATRSGIPRERLGRMDGTARLALAAVSALAHAVGRDRLKGAGIVLGTALATLDVNALYADGMRRRGAAHAEGRRFAYTTPNAAAGECAIAFGLTGPNLAVGRGLDAATEADEVARDLLRGGDADSMVVVALEAEGPVTREVAALLDADIPFGARGRLLVVER